MCTTPAASGNLVPTAGTPAKVILLIRRSHAFWLSGEIDPDYILRDDRRAAKVRAAVRQWDETFWLGYRDFRLELRAIAADAHAGAGFDEIIPWCDRSAVQSQPPGAWLVPVDEDDWLAPRIVGELRDVCPKHCTDLLTWDVVRKAADGAARPNPNTFVESCGYAVRLPFDWGSVCDHMRLRLPMSPTLPSVLSVRNETPASMSFLYRNSVEGVVSALRKAVTATDAGIPPEFHGPWSRYQVLLDRLLRSTQKSRAAARRVGAHPAH